MSQSKFSIYRTHLREKRSHGRGVDKDWHEVLIVNTTLGHTLHVTRWGAARSWGSMEIERFTRAYDRADHKAAVDRVEARGFEIEAIMENTNLSLDDLRKLLNTTYWFKLGASNLKFLDPEIDTTGMREAEPPVEFEEVDGKRRAKRPPPRTFEIPEETVEEKVAQNELWGMF